MLNVLILLAALCAPVIDDLKAIKQLPDTVPTYSWYPPTGYVVDEAVEIARIVGSHGTTPEGGVAAVTASIDVCSKANAKRATGTKPVLLTVVLRPWNISPSIDPTTDAAWKEFGKLNTQLRAVTTAMQAATWKPKLVVMIDAEGLDGSTDAKKEAMRELYGTYDLIVRSWLQPEAVEWYGFGAVPAPANPDEWGFHSFAVPFDGMTSMGFEWYYTGEAIGRRMSSHKARAYATSLGITRTTCWITTPGGGRQFQFAPQYSTWTNNVGPDTSYAAQLGRELYVNWYRARPARYMDPVNAVACYPHWLTPTIIDPERKQLIAFLKAATE